MYLTSQKVRAESKKIPLDPPLQKGEAVELPGLIEKLRTYHVKLLNREPRNLRS